MPIMRKQSGFVSMIIVITLSILLTLLTLAFIKVMGRGQRQILDSQLSTQAYYAAETGINDAMKAIVSNPTGVPTGDDTNCDPSPIDPVSGAKPNPVISNGEITVSYTCQLITTGTKDVLVTATEGTAKTYPLYTPGSNAQSVTIEWEDQSVNNAFSTGGAQDFVAADTWNGLSPAMMRITIYKTGGSGSSTDFINNQMNFFVKPGTVATGADAISMNSVDGVATLAKCATIAADRPYACRITISDVGGTGIANSVFIRIQPIYKNSNYRFTTSTTNNFSLADAPTLYGAQYRIDVTGRANDVFRRLEVRLPLSGFVAPDSGIDSSSICKKFEWNGSGVVNQFCAP